MKQLLCFVTRAKWALGPEARCGDSVSLRPPPPDSAPPTTRCWPAGEHFWLFFLIFFFVCASANVSKIIALYLLT